MRVKVTREDIEAGLRQMGLGQGDAVEVHSSLSSLGWVEGGAATVVDALMNVVGEEGTLLMSAYPVSPPLPLTEEDKCRGIRAKVRFLEKSSTERTGMGAIADEFRGRPGTVLGPGFHRVCAWGRDAQLHSGGYRHLLDIDGWVLLIGVDIHSCSSMHLAEGPDGLPEEIKRITRPPDDILRDYPKDAWYIQYGETEDAWGKVQAAAECRGLIRRQRIGQAACMLFKARPVVEIYREALRHDPLGLFGVTDQGTEPQPDLSTEVVPWPADWSAYLGQTITVEGTALNAKLGALLRGPGPEIWIADLDGWPEGYYLGGDSGRRVRVRGTVVERHDLPVFVQRKGEPQRTGMPVPEGTDLRAARQRYLLQDAEWELLE
jgi:aminoglycoside 3-N-acetyltransferase